MTQEEKARAYDEALERARAMYESQDDAELAAYIFPELAESEDERIIKTLYEYVKNRNWMINGPTQKDCLAWLEKQKENPDRVNLIGKAKSEKQVVLLAESNGDENIYWDTKSEEDAVSLLEKGLKFFGKQKPAEWSEEDEKMREHIISDLREFRDCETDKELVSDYEDEIAWLKSLRHSWKPSEDEERLINTSISFLKDFADKGYENAVECIDWLKSKLK